MLFRVVLLLRTDLQVGSSCAVGYITAVQNVLIRFQVPVKRRFYDDPVYTLRLARSVDESVSHAMLRTSPQ
jgi:hypothetical protein